MIWGWSTGRGWEFFSSPPRPDRLWGPSSFLSNGYQGVERPRREAENRLHQVQRPRMLTVTPPIPQYTFMAWCSVKKSQLQLYPYNESDVCVHQFCFSCVYEQPIHMSNKSHFKTTLRQLYECKTVRISDEKMKNQVESCLCTIEMKEVIYIYIYIYLYIYCNQGN
jgi:hypothetical protein